MPRPTLEEFLADCRDWLAADTYLTPDERERAAGDIAAIEAEARQLREREAPDAPPDQIR